MEGTRSRRNPRLIPFLAAAAFLAGASGGLLGVCGPFTDVTDAGFCPFVLEIFTLGITTGTTATTYDPTSTVSRLQMAAFLSRSVDTALRHKSPRAVAKQFWTPQNAGVLGVTTVGAEAALVRFDGADLWVANNGSNTVSRVRASDAKLLETWTGATSANGVGIAMNRILVTGSIPVQGALYAIDPSQTAGAVTTVATNLGPNPISLTFDGARVWTANQGSGVSIITPGASIPWTVTNVTTGFTSMLGVVYDGANVWATDFGAARLYKLDAAGAILQTVTVGAGAAIPVFDGGNIWVPNFLAASVTVVRASSGAILQTLTANGLSQPVTGAFDGERVLVTNELGNSVSLWKAADLTTLGTFPMGAATQPSGAASDGRNFWVALALGQKLVRF